MTSSNPNYFPKAPPPTITYEFGRGHKHSVHLTKGLTLVEVKKLAILSDLLDILWTPITRVITVEWSMGHTAPDPTGRQQLESLDSICTGTSNSRGVHIFLMCFFSV